MQQCIDLALAAVYCFVAYVILCGRLLPNDQGCCIKALQLSAGSSSARPLQPLLYAVRVLFTNPRLHPSFPTSAEMLCRLTRLCCLWRVQPVAREPEPAALYTKALLAALWE